MEKYNLPIKALLSYLMPGLLCLLFALFIDIRFGFIFLAVYLLLPAISLSLAKITADRTTLSVSCSNLVLGKGNRTELQVDIHCTAPVSFAYLDIDLLQQNRLETIFEQTVSLTLGRQASETLPVSYTAAICGPASCGINSAVVRDFLGFHAFPLTQIVGNPAEVSVLPNIPEIAPNPLLRAALENSSIEEEEEVPQTIQDVGGVPGYEHRRYFPGDPLKRINWKLSAKRDQLMVRQLEAVSAVKISIVLDAFCQEVPETKEQLLEAQLTVEAALAMARLITSQGIECDVSYWLDADGWRTFLLREGKDVERLQFELSGFSFVNKDMASEKAPASLQKQEGCILVFTLNPDSLSNLQQGGSTSNSYEIVFPEGIRSSHSGWVVDRDMIFTKTGA